MAWQATAIAGTGLLIGLPLGVAAGRWAWTLLARGFAIEPVTVISPGLLLSVPAVLLMANPVAATRAGRGADPARRGAPDRVVTGSGPADRGTRRLHPTASGQPVSFAPKPGRTRCKHSLEGLTWQAIPDPRMSPSRVRACSAPSPAAPMSLVPEPGGTDVLGAEAGGTDELGPEEGGTDELGPEAGGIQAKAPAAGPLTP